MKTKKFITRLKELGFEYEKAEEVYFIYDYEGTEYAAVCHTTPNQISNMEREWDLLDKDTQDKLFDLLVEYAKTPIEEREEEKKFYLRHRYFKYPDGGSKYFTYNRFSDTPNLGCIYFEEIDNAKFTLKESEEIKKKFDTDLKDFEFVEVEDE